MLTKIFGVLFWVWEQWFYVIREISNHVRRHAIAGLCVLAATWVAYMRGIGNALSFLYAWMAGIFRDWITYIIESLFGSDVWGALLGNEWLVSVLRCVKLFIPLGELFIGVWACSAVWLGLFIYRVVKSWIPTVSG